MNTLVVASAGLVAGIVVWWLAARRLTTRSWEPHGVGDALGTTEMLPMPTQKVGLWILLAVITSLFGLFVTAYALRMSPHPIKGPALGDWRPLPEPPILWLNSVALVLASVGMQVARSAGRLGRRALARNGLLAGGVFALLFLAGQLMAWNELRAAGFYAAGNPANAFFYVLTGVHGLHIAGGLVAWAVSFVRFDRGGTATARSQLDVELCTVYFHYLLAVWLVLFGLLLVT
jgi:cytochrome c oxidase subunit 3